MSDKGKAKAQAKDAKGKSAKAARPGKGKASKGATSKTPAGRKAAVRERQAAAGRQAYELTEFSDDIAAHAQAFVTAVRDIATATSPDTAVSELLVQLAQVSMAGSMLGAVQDVVPDGALRGGPWPGPRRRPAASRAGRPADRCRRVRRGRRPAAPLRRCDAVPGLRRRGRGGCRARARAAALRGGPRRRGALVVAVLLPVDVGAALAVGPPGPAVDHQPPAARRRRGRDGGRPGRRAAPA